MCKAEQLNVALWKEITFIAEIGIFLTLCLLLLNIYIHHGRVAHRHKFPSCQSELLVGCRDDEEHTALKWDWSSNPVYSPGSISYTFSL
jgi:hypothetical protein